MKSNHYIYPENARSGTEATKKDHTIVASIASVSNSPWKQRKPKNRRLQRGQSTGHSIGSSIHEYGLSPLNSTRRVKCSHSRSNENLLLVGSMERFHVQIKKRQESGDGDGYSSGKSSNFSYSDDNLGRI